MNFSSLGHKSLNEATGVEAGNMFFPEFQLIFPGESAPLGSKLGAGERGTVGGHINVAPTSDGSRK